MVMQLHPIVARFLVGLSVASFAGCGLFSESSTVQLHAASSVPAASGSVEVTPTDQGNMELAIEVDHLAPASSLAKGATTYVAWAEPIGEGSAQNIGALKVGEDRSGKLVTKLPQQAARILLTPEPAAAMTEPTNEPVLWATVQAHR